MDSVEVSKKWGSRQACCYCRYGKHSLSVQTCSHSNAYLVAFSSFVLQAKRPSINPAPATGHPDPFNRKSVRKPQKPGQKKQQGSSRFRSKPSFEIQPLGLLKGGWQTDCITGPRPNFAIFTSLKSIFFSKTTALFTNQTCRQPSNRNCSSKNYSSVV